MKLVKHVKAKKVSEPVSLTKEEESQLMGQIMDHFLEEILSEENSEDEYNNSMLEIENEKYKIGRNEKCPCGSGVKYKKCCLSLNC